MESFSKVWHDGVIFKGVARWSHFQRCGMMESFSKVWHDEVIFKGVA